MQPHVRNYLKAMDCDIHTWIKCEIPDCGQKGVDIHHVIFRSHFGKKTKHLQDDISNLIALCRDHHNEAHSRDMKNELLEIIKNR